MVMPKVHRRRMRHEHAAVGQWGRPKVLLVADYQPSAISNLSGWGSGSFPVRRLCESALSDLFWGVQLESDLCDVALGVVGQNTEIPFAVLSGVGSKDSRSRCPPSMRTCIGSWGACHAHAVLQIATHSSPEGKKGDSS